MENASLEIVQGVDWGKVFHDLTFPVTSGRVEGNSIQLNDGCVTRFHLELHLVDGAVVARDKDSRSGTYVNSRLCSDQVLTDGDEIRVGRTILKFRSSND